MAEKFYITTAIDYVNGAPHIGHAFEKVLADAIARWNRLLGKDVWFLIGTDENASKNAQVAKEKNIPIKEFVDKNSEIFKQLCLKLNISFSRFIKTTEKEHIKKAQEIFKKVHDLGDIYKGNYEGFYCKGCEAFITEKDLVDGKCPEHNKKPELIKEETYFFKLSKYEKQILKFAEKYIVPEQRKKEIISRIKEQGLKDLCVARKNLDWGIDCPIDKKYKIYVWFDALINYITGAGKNQEYWPADLHVIGKGINWFHSVIWPAMLISAKIDLPKKLLVHGYLTLDSQKISKSLGNTIDPIELLKKYTTDSLRYSLLRCNVFEDSDYSEETLIQRHNTELLNKLGNLVSRTAGLIEANGFKQCKNSLAKKINLEKIKNLMQNFETDKALNEIFAFIDVCNEYLQSKKPWETKNKEVLYEVADSIKKIAILLYPFIPETSEKIAKQFGNFKISLKEFDKPLSKTSKIKKANHLFTKIEQENINKQETPKEIMAGITSIEFTDFEKIHLKVGEIEKVEDIKDADKLYKLTICLGSETRIICAGIKQFYSHDDLKGKKVIVLTNLKPRQLKGISSQGMLLAAVSKDNKQVSLITPDADIEVGSKVG